MKVVDVVFFAALLCASNLVASDGVIQTDELVGTWHELPLPPSKDHWVSVIALEPGGVLWTMANRGLYYWDGHQFRSPVVCDHDGKPYESDDVKVTSGQYLTRLYGGPDRGLFATQRGEKEHQGRLYELSDGRAVYVTTFYYETSGDHPRVYISKSGGLFNWGRRFLAVYAKDKWQRVEAALGYPVIFDTGKKVYFYGNQNIYSLDQDGTLEKREFIAPTKSVRGALWGTDKMFIFKSGRNRAYACNLETGQPVYTEHITRYLGNRGIWDIFRASDGAVWLLTHDEPFRSCYFLRVAPDGEITTVAETIKLGLDFSEFRRSVLNASDGSVWFVTPLKGIGRYHNGKMDVFGWKQGMSLGRCQYLLEDPQGNIYAASHEGIYVFRRGQTGDLPAWVSHWQEHRLASSRPVRDSQGNIWVCLEDRPDEISRWDGYQWHHVPVPFNTSKVGRVMADDRGHVLLETRDDIGGWYDIGPNSVKRHRNLEFTLVAAVSRGARRFDTDRSFQGCVVLPDGRIWFGYQQQDRVHYFDGERWDQLRMNDNIWYLYESPKHGVLMRTQGRRYYTYDRGQLIEIDIPDDSPTRWLLGPKLLQPFEEELLEKYPCQYVPVERAEDGQLYLLLPSDNDNSSDVSGKTDVRGAALPQTFSRYPTTITPGFGGGHWSDHMPGRVFRFFGNNVFECSFSNTPLLDKEDRIDQVFEDRAHNLWIEIGRGYSGVFVKRLDHFKLKVQEVPNQAKRSVTITADALLGGFAQPGTRLFWRLEGGDWRGGELGNSVTVHFPSQGTYKVEIVGLGPLGGVTPETLSFTVYAKVPLPDTILTDEGPYICKDVTWPIPAEAIPSEAGQVPYLSYRLNDGKWCTAHSGGTVMFGGLEPGEYHIQVAACEDNRYYDSTPLAFSVKYAPDYDGIVERRLGIIIGDDPEQARAALSEIKMMGPRIIPALEKRLREARKATRLIRTLEQLLQEFGREARTYD